MSKPLKCANSYPRVDGKPGPCASGPASMTISVSMGTDTQGEPIGTRNEAFALFCPKCATSILNWVVESAQAQAKGST